MRCHHLVMLTIAVLVSSDWASADDNRSETNSDAKAEDTVPRTAVRVNGRLQPGFAQREICRDLNGTEECAPAIVHEETDKVLSLNGRWLSACRADGEPVKGFVDEEADVACHLRPPQGPRKRPPLPASREEALAELGRSKG